MEGVVDLSCDVAFDATDGFFLGQAILFHPARDVVDGELVVPEPAYGDQIESTVCLPIATEH